MIFSGNMNSYHEAVKDINSLGYFVIHSEVEHGHETLRVELPNGYVVIAKSFKHRDEDVMVMSQSAWLRKVFADLKVEGVNSIIPNA